MPIGIVSDSEFEKEFNNVVKLPQSDETETGVIEELETPGRAPGDNNVPDSLRKILADTNLNSGRSVALKLAENLDISPSSVSAYAKGATSTATIDKPNRDLSEFLNKRKTKIANKASKILHTALDEITPEKLTALKTVEVATVAKTMSSIIKDMEPEQVQNQGNTFNGPSIVLYAPQLMNESKMDVIHVNET